MYSIVSGEKLNFTRIFQILYGLVFIFLGNYLPKIKQNRTLGIRVPWTLNNEENWNKTHRFGGKVWLIGGFLMLFSGFLPLKYVPGTLLISVFPIVIIPILYSYIIFKKDQESRVEYVPKKQNKIEKTVTKISLVITAPVLIAVMVLTFTGDISISYEDKYFQAKATYWGDYRVHYTDVDTIEYRKDLNVGTRTFGLGSARLLTGNFQNEEFGAYTLCAYTNAKEFVVLTSEEKIFVIGMHEAKDTKEVYDTLLEKTGKGR